MTPQPQISPVVDFTPLKQAAVATYELFAAYVEAGFTRDEALKIVVELTRAPLAGGPS